MGMNACMQQYSVIFIIVTYLRSEMLSYTDDHNITQIDRLTLHKRVLRIRFTAERVNISCFLLDGYRRIRASKKSPDCSSSKVRSIKSDILMIRGFVCNLYTNLARRAGDSGSVDGCRTAIINTLKNRGFSCLVRILAHEGPCSSVDGCRS